MLAVVVILAAFYGSNAYELFDCAKGTSMQTLDLKSLEGKWYEFSSFGTIFNHGLLDRCKETTISAGSDGKSFIMSMDRIVKVINAHMKSKWLVTAKGEKLTGDLLLTFKLPLVGSLQVPLKVLGTDNYKNYIIFNACYSVASIFKFNLGFILTKKRHYDAKELESLYSSIDEVLKNNGLTRSQFSLANQRNCNDKTVAPAKTDSSEETLTLSQTTQPLATTTGAVAENKVSGTATDSGPATTAEKTVASTDAEKPAASDSGSATTAEKTVASTDAEKPAASDSGSATTAEKTVASTDAEKPAASDSGSATTAEKTVASTDAEKPAASETEKSATVADGTSASSSEKTGDTKTESSTSSETEKTSTTETEKATASDAEKNTAS